jgi:DNA-binding SARP family transcriptional activator
LDELRLGAVEKRIDADLALGREEAVTAELQGLVAEHPLRERVRGQLMLARRLATATSARGSAQNA